MLFKVHGNQEINIFIVTNIKCWQPSSVSAQFHVWLETGFDKIKLHRYTELG